MKKNSIFSRVIQSLMCLTLFSSVVTTSCSTHHNASQTPASGAPIQAFYAGQISAIPLHNSNTYYSFQLYNGTDNPMIIQQSDVVLLNQTIQTISLHNKKLHSSQEPLIDVSSCAMLAAHGECRVQVNLNGNITDTAGEFGVKINSHAINSKESFSTTTVISYFTPTTSQAVAFSVDGIANINMPSNQTTSVSIPMLFQREYHDIKISNAGLLNTNLVGCESSQILAGSTCMLQIELQGGRDISSNVIMTGVSEVTHLREQILFTPILNSASTIGHLLIGTTNSTIKANGSSSITVTVANNGTAAITAFEISVQNNSAQLVLSNTCNGSILPNASCSVIVRAPAGYTGNNIGHYLKFSYNNGLNNLADLYPINVIPDETLYATLEVSTTGSFIDSVLNGGSTTESIHLHNSGNITLSGLTRIYIPNLPTEMEESTTCSNNLQPNASCDYIITYSPTAATSLSSFKAVFTGHYSYSQQPRTISSTQTIQYSAVINDNDLKYDLATMTFNTNIQQSVIQTIVVRNQSDSPVSAIQFDFTTVTPPYSNNYTSVDNPITVTIPRCDSPGVVLYPGSSCAMTVQFASSTAYADSGQFQIQYILNSTPKTDVIPYQTNAVSSGVDITVARAADGSNLGTTGDILNPYFFKTLAGNDFSLKFTYTNTGIADAANFSVNSILPVGYTVDTSNTTCPSNGTMGILGQGSSCVFAILAYNPSIFNAGNAAGSLNIPTPSVSYTDSISGDFFKINTYPNVYVHFMGISNANMVVGSPTYDINTNKFSSVITFIPNSSSNTSYGMKYVVNSPSSSDVDSITFASSTDGANNYCHFDDTNNLQTCTVTVSYYSKSRMFVEASVVPLNTQNGLTWNLYGQIQEPPQAFVYVQDGSNLQAYMWYGSGVLPATGNPISSGTTKPSIVMGSNLVLASSSGISVYPINTDGTLGSVVLSTPTISGIIIALANYSNNLYVATSTNNVYNCTMNPTSLQFTCGSELNNSAVTGVLGIVARANSLYISTDSTVVLCNNDLSVCTDSSFGFSTNLTGAINLLNSNTMLLSYAGSNKLLTCTFSTDITDCTEGTGRYASNISGISTLTTSYNQPLDNPIYAVTTPFNNAVTISETQNFVTLWGGQAANLYSFAH